MKCVFLCRRRQERDCVSVLFFIFSLIWYLPLYFRQGKTDKLPFKYCLLAIFLGMVPVFIVSVAAQVLWGL